MGPLSFARRVLLAPRSLYCAYWPVPALRGPGCRSSCEADALPAASASANVATKIRMIVLLRWGIGDKYSHTLGLQPACHQSSACAITTYKSRDVPGRAK